MTNNLSASIKQIDPSLPFPEYHTKGSAGFDLYARLDITLKPHEIGRVPLNVVIVPPPGYWSLLAVRGSFHKRGLLPANGVGIMDADYIGEDDEYQLIVFNATESDVTIKRGDRIAQVIFIPFFQAELKAVQQTDAPSRGGLGSTDKLTPSQ